MKKLLFLFSIFAITLSCSSDDSVDEKNLTLKQYLTSNVFTFRYFGSEIHSDGVDVNPQVDNYYRFTFANELYKMYTFSESTWNWANTEIPFNTCCSKNPRLICF